MPIPHPILSLQLYILRVLPAGHKRARDCVMDKCPVSEASASKASWTRVGVGVGGGGVGGGGGEGREGWEGGSSVHLFPHEYLLSPPVLPQQSCPRACAEALDNSPVIQASQICVCGQAVVSGLNVTFSPFWSRVKRWQAPVIPGLGRQRAPEIPGHSQLLSECEVRLCLLSPDVRHLQAEVWRLASG